MCEKIKNWLGSDATHQAISAFVSASESFEPCTYVVQQLARCGDRCKMGGPLRWATFICVPLDAVIKIVAAPVFAAFIPIVDIIGEQPILPRITKLLGLVLTIPLSIVFAGNPIAIFLIKPAQYVYEGHDATETYVANKYDNVHTIYEYLKKSYKYVSGSTPLSNSSDCLNIATTCEAINVSAAASELFEPCTWMVQGAAAFCGDNAIGNIVRLATFVSLPVDKVIKIALAPVFTAMIPLFDIIGPQPLCSRIVKGAGLVVVIPICIALIGNPILNFLSKLSIPCGYVVSGSEGSKTYIQNQNDAWAKVRPYSKTEL